jgi:hypothetical protein
MPSGFIMAGLCMAGGLFVGYHTAKVFAEGGKGWRKGMLISLAMQVPGSVIFALTL